MNQLNHIAIHYSNAHKDLEQALVRKTKQFDALVSQQGLYGKLRIENGAVTAYFFDFSDSATREEYVWNADIHEWEFQVTPKVSNQVVTYNDEPRIFAGVQILELLKDD